MAAFEDELVAQRVVDPGVDQEVAVRGAARSEVGGLAETRVAGGLGDVGRLVDDHRGVAGAHAVRRRPGAVGRLHHVASARGLDEVGLGHQVLRCRDARPLQAQQEVGGRPFPRQGAAHDLDRLPRGLLAARVRREDDGVATLDGEHPDTGRGELRVGGRHERRDQADRLGVLGDALVGHRLDHADTGLSEDVTEDAHDLEPLADPARRVADAALVDAHLREPGEGGLVGDRPGDGLAQPVDLLLGRSLELAQRDARSSDELIDVCRLFRCDRSRSHPDNPAISSRGRVRAALGGPTIMYSGPKSGTCHDRSRGFDRVSTIPAAAALDTTRVRPIRSSCTDAVPICGTQGDGDANPANDLPGASSMAVTAADHITSFLADRGVEVVFGLCGHTNISPAGGHRAGRRPSLRDDAP